MNVIENEVKAAIDKELQAATEKFGLHHSWHEKYAVMLEELEELEHEVRLTNEYLNSAWFGVKHNLEDYAEGNIPDVYEHAVKAACEAIQVAAMAKKEIEKPKEIAEPAELDDHGLYSGHDPVRVFRCTNCGNDFVSGIHPHPFYCPSCGAEFTNVLRL